MATILPPAKRADQGRCVTSRVIPNLPDGWREAIDKAVSAAPQPSPELCEKVAGLVAPALAEVLRQRDQGAVHADELTG